MKRSLFACVLLCALWNGAIATAIAPVLDPLPFQIVGSDYNGNRGTQPELVFDLVPIVNGWVAPEFAPVFPFHQSLLQPNGRTLVVDGGIKIGGYRSQSSANFLQLPLGHQIDLHRFEYTFGGGTYHSYWQDAPPDDQYGRWENRVCHSGFCQTGTDQKLGETEPVVGPYFFGTTQTGPENYGSVAFIFDVNTGTRMATGHWRIKNDGTYPPVVNTYDIQILPHSDGKSTWLRVDLGTEEHRISLDTSRPLSTWEEVDYWAALKMQRGTPTLIMTDTINGVTYPAVGGLATPEPSSGLLTLMSLSGLHFVRRRRA